MDKYSEKSDVWAFGVTCFEIIYRRIPYPDMNATQVTLKVVHENLHPTIPSEPEWESVAKGKTILAASIHSQLWECASNIDQKIDLALKRSVNC